MPDEMRVRQLVEELLASGSTPEEVCGSCPELLPAVRERWRQTRRVQAELDLLFPTPAENGASSTALSQEGTSLPRIPGYEVEGQLGRGGMGVVFRARHLRLNRIVALKMALADANASPQERERFQREAEAVAALRHANIVQIHDVGDADGRPYFTMEYVEGGSLAQKLAGTSQPARQAAALLATLAHAVQAAHQSGIVHRDLKPANVLLTADGTPKISDFGLARRLDGESGLTRTGATLGTPLYMAPEQARGKTDMVGPAADLYALGTILYECLTGQPPFRAETAVATLYQVAFQDPVPPSRLNAKVPRDLETICLKCLEKEPSRRYDSAAALAEDLDRFLRGEAIAARPEGWSGRLARRIRRQPALSAALVGSVLATLALIIGGLWLRYERAAAARRVKVEQAAIELAVLEDLREMTRWQEKSAWPEATAALERAKGRLGDRELPELPRRLEQGIRDLKLAASLDAVRLGRATRLGDKLAFKRSDEEYETAFHTAGLGSPQDAPDVVAARVQASNIRNALVAALDDWAACTRDPRRQGWVLAVARQADRDSTGWRSRARDPLTWTTKETLAEVVAETPVAGQSVPLLLALAMHMKSLGADPTRFLTRVQRAHRGDFWANFSLAEALKEKNELPDAIRYYQAAAAIRPKAAVVYDHLGLALALLGRMTEADEHFREALRIDPTAAPTHVNLGITFSTMGRQEPIDRSKLPRYFTHKVAVLHTILADDLRTKGKLVEALDRYRLAVALDPRLTGAQDGLRVILRKQGRLDEMQLAWGKAIDAAPPEYDAWDGYAELCLFLGREDEYRRARRALLGRFGSSREAQIAERAGRACLLLPGSPEEMQKAATLIDRALAADKGTYPDWAYTYYLFAKGLADYRLNRPDCAIRLMEGEAAKVLGPAPGLVLAMAQHCAGHKEQARKTLAAAVLSHHWRPEARSREDWIFHILRREAEALILPTLRAFLEGKHQPRNNDERLALLEGCRYMKRPLAAARLYTQVFAADLDLAKDVRAAHRASAARLAALAGCGQGEDGVGLAQRERSRWRAQARQWLRADLAGWNKELEDGTAETRERARQTLTQWQRDPDLAGLHDPIALGKLPAAERTECLALWREVDVVLERTRKER
jgi:serine/threonine-protein kinase